MEPSSLEPLVGAFPRLMCTRVMTSEEFEQAFAAFVAAYVPEFKESPFWTRTMMLENLVSSPIEYNAAQYAPTVGELADRLQKIGGAMIMLIQSEAIRDDASVIGDRRLGEFIARISGVRRFVQLDEDGLEYAITA